MTRGDRGTIDAHLAALAEHAPSVGALYRAAAEREIDARERRGALTPEAAAGPPVGGGSGACNARPDAVPLPPMEHSIAARYAARPTARFVTPVGAGARAPARAPRAAGTFHPAVHALTVLQRPRRRRSSPSSAATGARSEPARPRRSLGGRPRPAVAISWTGSAPRRLDAPIQRRHGAVARLRTATATSAGGIVVRFDDGIPSLVVGTRRRDRDSLTWTLPKGTPNAGETREQTALREVAEETGLEVRITDVLDSIEYWFVQRGTRIHKTVHYFLMEPIGGDLARHDHEFDQVRWVPLRRGAGPADVRDGARARRPCRRGRRPDRGSPGAAAPSVQPTARRAARRRLTPGAGPSA